MTQLFLALAFLATGAVATAAVGSARNLHRVTSCKKAEMSYIGTEDALLFPISGSVILFSLYVLLRFIPMDFFNILLSFYLCAVGALSLVPLLTPIGRTSTGCWILGGAIAICSFYYQFWIANNILAFALAVSSLESIHVSRFLNSAVLLVGLFAYDVFWVYGTDVMLTVATKVDGPIKFLFPQSLFGNHEKKSLLGLGDIVIPGFFIAQTLVYSRLYVKRGNFYYYVSLGAYFLSLVNTMIVMVVFEHGQPALLFIVPWLLLSFFIANAVKGDLWKAIQFDSDCLLETNEVTASAEKKSQ